jgi:hypothetical protein
VLSPTAQVNNAKRHRNAQIGDIDSLLILVTPVIIWKSHRLPNGLSLTDELLL